MYSSVLAYLRAAKAAGSIEGERVIEAMRAHPIEDKLFGPVTVRADGRAIHPMYVFRVKTPAESKTRWDLYALIATIPAGLTGLLLEHELWLRAARDLELRDALAARYAAGRKGMSRYPSRGGVPPARPGRLPAREIGGRGSAKVRYGRRNATTLSTRADHRNWSIATALATR